MNNLNDLLDKSFGVIDSQTLKTKKQKVKNDYRRQMGIYLSKDECKDLIISLNYAINSIKNKKEVIEKRKNATRYIYFERWTKIRRRITEKLETK